MIILTEQIVYRRFILFFTFLFFPFFQLIGIRALFNQLTCLGVEKFKSNIILRCEELVRDMWQKNGDQCSLIYAGTGALEGKSKVFFLILKDYLREYKEKE